MKLKYHNFSKSNSLKYCNDAKFREYIQSIISPNKISLDFSYSNISDVSMLGDIYELNLTHCKNITDVSMLGRVYNINLLCCDQISDVSMLGGVHTLKLIGCNKITDISMLGVHTLYFKLL